MSAVTSPMHEATPGLVVRDEVAVYMDERGKPLLGAEHALCQTRLAYQLMQREEFLILCELNLELMGIRTVPNLCVHE